MLCLSASISVWVLENGVCVHISSEAWVWYVCDVLYALLYVGVCCCVVRGCPVARRYINVRKCDMISVVDVYLDHLKFCAVCIDGRRYVCCSECNVVSNECNEPTYCLVQPIGTHSSEVMYFGCVCFRGELGFLNCDDICMSVVNKQFELIEFVLIPFMLTYSRMRFLSLLLLGLCPCVVYVVMWSSLVCLWVCRGTICRCGGCYDCDACTVVCVACLYAERV